MDYFDGGDHVRRGFLSTPYASLCLCSIFNMFRAQRTLCMPSKKILFFIPSLDAW
ncbi:hypothetical protein P692DRAFT_20835286 [Suillus brevipes Sb2]|nr:hypothetical protein P692DRAFT_20835286 [Suillus brevipes Sb2]